MMSLIDISNEEYSLLNRYIGQGKPNTPIIFFGNEPGTSHVGVKDTIEHLKHDDRYDVSTGFMLKESYAHPTTSDFARFIARLCIGLKYEDDRWFYSLTNLGKITLNEHISSPLSLKDYSLVNLRPLPRPTQDTWDYSNIDKKDYLRKWNFTLKRHYSDSHKEERISVLKTFFDKRTGLVIGIGEKENKRKFFEYLYPEIEFFKADLDNHSIYFSISSNIILSDYFNNRNGIKTIGLKDLYDFMISRKLVSL